ncbi:MAG TPA: class 1 isoprenoid biosynthesis enzyme, partial [Segetibacter sp.]
DEKEYPGNVQLLISINKELQKIWHPSDKYIEQLKVALEWQSVSSQQLDPNITLEEIVKICREKNGNTSLMFATLVDEEWTQAELDFIYQSAIVGQLTNDAFDIYFDSQNGIQTYFNTAPNIEQVRAFFISECKQLHYLVRKCNATNRNKENTIRRMCILHAFTLTALDQLAATESRHNKPIDWKTVHRKEMVIDMAKNSNRWKTVQNMKWLAEQ